MPQVTKTLEPRFLDGSRGTSEAYSHLAIKCLVTVDSVMSCSHFLGHCLSYGLAPLEPYGMSEESVSSVKK